MLKHLLALSLVLPLSAQEWGKDWTKTDTVLEVAAISLYLADLGQTLDIERHNAHPDRYPMPGRTPYFEKNPFLGKHPSRATINAYFIALIASHVFISGKLKHGWARTTYQTTTIFYSYNTVYSNHQIGLKISF